MLAISELDVVRALLPCNHVVTGHVGCEFVVPPQIIGLILRVDVEVRDGRVVRGVLAVNLSPIRKLALQSFSKKRVEGLHLRVANVQTANRIGNNQLQSLKMVICLSRLA